MKTPVVTETGQIKLAFTRLKAAPALAPHFFDGSSGSETSLSGFIRSNARKNKRFRLKRRQSLIS